METSLICQDPAGWIYVLDDGQGHYKIGKTKDLDMRVKQLKIQLPYRVRVLIAFCAPDRHAAEGLVHYHLRNLRVNGEWFRVDMDDDDDCFDFHTAMTIAGMEWWNSCTEHKGQFVVPELRIYDELYSHDSSKHQAGLHWFESQCVRRALNDLPCEPSNAFVDYLVPLGRVAYQSALHAQ